jgi:WD40 repeat protein
LLLLLLLSSQSSSRQKKKKKKKKDVAFSQKPQVVDEYAFTGIHCLFDHHKTSVTCLCFANGDRSLLALGCADGSASIVNTTTSAVRLIPAPSKSSSVSDVAWSSGNEWLLVGRRQESTVLYEASSLRALRVFSQPCACVAFHPANDNLLLLAGPGGAVQFNASTGAALSQPVLKLSGRETATSCCWPSPDLLFVGSSEGRLFVISPSSRTVTVVRAGAPINSLSFHSWMLRRQSVRELLVSVPSATGKGASLLVYRLGVEMKVIASFRVPNKALRVRSRFCPLAPASRDGSCVVSGGENAELLVFDVCRFGKSRPLINALHGHTAPVLDVAWAFDETLLASSDLSGLVIVWKRKFV